MGRMTNGNNTGGSQEARGELEGKYTQVSRLRVRYSSG